MPDLKGPLPSRALRSGRLLVIDKRAGHQHHRYQPGEPRRPGALPVQGSARRRVAAELPLVAASGSAFQIRVALAWRISVCRETGRSRRRGDANGAIPLAYSVRDTIADAEQAIGVYVAYRPQRLVFDNAADHPTQLVESAAMASVALPAPSYVPQLPAKVIRDRVLSRAQLETLVHALDATSSDLPGRYRVPERGLELVPDAEGAMLPARLLPWRWHWRWQRPPACLDPDGSMAARHRRHLWISESNA
jgi:hypothetical protein